MEKDRKMFDKKTSNNNNDAMANTAHQVRAGKLTKSLLIRADDSGQLPSEIEILQTGMWDAPYHGMFMVTRDDLSQYVLNYNSDVRPNSSTSGLPIDAEHDTDGGAYGWLKSLYIVDNPDGTASLWAKTEWTSLGVTALSGGIYKFFSPEFCPDGYQDPEGFAEDCDNVLLGGGLTNRPLFKNLTPVMASDGSKKAGDESKIYIDVKETKLMPTLDEVRVKDAATLSADEKQFLTDNKTELSADELTKFGFEVEAPVVEPVVEPVVVAPIATPVAASDKTAVTISASELTALKEQAAQGVLANSKLMASEATAEIEGLAFTASDGIKFKMDQKSSVVDFYISCSDKQRKAFVDIIKEMPAAVSASSFVASGSRDDAASDGQAYSQLKVEADKLMASDKTLTFDKALVQASDANPELAKAYSQVVAVK